MNNPQTGTLSPAFNDQLTASPSILDRNIYWPLLNNAEQTALLERRRLEEERKKAGSIIQEMQSAL